MKANGRRRWRRRAKWLRHRTRTDWPQLLEYATDRVRASLLRIRKSRNSLPLPPLPPRPFSPRSLVGMSQGARKRAAWKSSAFGYYSVVAERAKLRLGERLRPCPGCTACLVCLACENNNCRRKHLPVQYCDGSGVLPAWGTR